ncbi:hypothetical protein B1H18_34755 [Streptomyces tsukubensis]|uniref:Uncharacterized protein n=1 Tax=Streptomyces tsukubensis TaxID=83656 RepID=A0A1V3ZZB6_9ACTN|nr:hypothetical protein B1H18_34755 [Streptomyces tsukubensis]
MLPADPSARVASGDAERWGAPAGVLTPTSVPPCVTGSDFVLGVPGFASAGAPSFEPGVGTERPGPIGAASAPLSPLPRVTGTDSERGGVTVASP